jgi:uncharacterized protein
MTINMERFLKKLAYVIFLYHKRIVIIFSLLTIVSFITIFNMEIRSDIIDVLPAKNKAVVQFKDFMEKYGTMDNVVVAIESDGDRIDEQIDLIEDLTKRLIASPFIEYVDYSPLKSQSDFFLKHFPLFLSENGLKHLIEKLTPAGIEQQIRQNRQRLLSPFGSPFDSELIAKDPLNIADIIKNSFVRSDKNELDLSMGYYFTPDYSTALIFAKPKGKSKDMAFVKNLKKELDIIASLTMSENGNPIGTKIGFTGGYILSEDVRQIIKHDIVSSSAVSVFLIALLIWLAYRVRLKILLVIGFVMLASLAMTLAFAYLLFGSINIVTSVVTAVLIGLYVDYSMHTVKRYSDELRKCNDSLLALEVTMAKTGSAIIISGITTSLSFFSIVVTNFKGLYELGIISGIGVILCLITTLFLMNSLLAWISKHGLQNIQFGKPGNEVSYVIVSFANFIMKKHRYIVLIGITLVIVAGLGISKLRFDNNPDNLAPKDSPAIDLGKKISGKIGKKGEPLTIIIQNKDRNELMVDFDTLEKSLSLWKTEGFIEDYNSLGMLMPASSIQSIKIDKLKEFRNSTFSLDSIGKTVINALKKNNFDYDKDYIHKYLTGIMNALNSTEFIGLNEIETISSPMIGRFYNKDDSSIAAYLYPTHRGWDKQTVDVFQEYVESEGTNWLLVGKPILVSEIKSSIIWGSALATTLTVFLNFSIIYLYFRKVGYAVLVLLPVTLGYVLTMGIMGYMNIPFNLINIGTTVLIFGFGVDYGIYVMQSYIGEEKMDIGNALQISGKNVMMGAATTIAGCGSLMTAKFTGIATIGPVLTIGAIACACTALIVLPSIIYLNKNKIKNERF